MAHGFGKKNHIIRFPFPKTNVPKILFENIRIKRTAPVKPRNLNKNLKKFHDHRPRPTISNIYLFD